MFCFNCYGTIILLSGSEGIRKNWDHNMFVGGGLATSLQLRHRIIQVNTHIGYRSGLKVQLHVDESFY